MEIFFGLLIIIVKLIQESAAEKRAEEYANTVVRRHNRNESEETR